ncbi:protein LSM14 homolog B [Sergentomyia squamirostris]
MSGNMPELGSKISLISKADIRYEGRLFTVDPNECTIALANVRSFGTEDRETQFPIAAQNQVYDYILFRGSDIKDIRVCNSAPIPNDPAIMQMHLPPQMGQQPFQPPHFPMTLGHPMGGPPQMGQFGPYGMPMGGAAPGATNQNLAPGPNMPGAPGAGSMQKQKASDLNVVLPEATDFNKGGEQASMLEFIGGGSRSTTPQSLVSRKSPTMDMGVQVNQPIGRNDANKRTSERGGGGGGAGPIGSNQSQPKNNNTHQRERRDSGRNAGLNNQENQVPRDGDKNKQYQNKWLQQRNQNQGGPAGGNNNHNNQGQPNQQQRGWVQRGGQMRGGRGRMNRGGPNQNFRQAGGPGGPNAKTRGGKSIKFDSDYDFEQANSKFEELRSQLAKLKVGEEAKPEQQVNGESEKKDDSGNETGAGEQEIEEEGDIVVGYDKTKSFFDNISCEAAQDRSKGKNRTDWRQERKLNSETFGVSSTRRGGFRGRGGGYYNRGPNMGMGGYRGGNYRSNNYRGNRSNNMRQTGGNQSTGVPQPQKKPNNTQQSTGSATTSAGE